MLYAFQLAVCVHIHIVSRPRKCVIILPALQTHISLHTSYLINVIVHTHTHKYFSFSHCCVSARNVRFFISHFRRTNFHFSLISTCVLRKQLIDGKEKRDANKKICGRTKISCGGKILTRYRHMETVPTPYHGKSLASQSLLPAPVHRAVCSADTRCVTTIKAHTNEQSQQ